MTIAEVLPEPLPLVLDEAPDESLSSWLNRHAEFYGVSPSALNLRAGINTPSFARIDYWPTAGEACSIASAMRRTPEMILSMTHQPYTRNDVQRQIWRGRVLDVVIPGFDDVDRHAPFTVHTATPLVAPLPIRVALLAGLWRTQNNPDLYDRIESACSGRESIRFDAAKIKLLADAHPAFSHLQQIRDSSPFWSRYFLQRKRRTAPVSRFRAT